MLSLIMLSQSLSSILIAELTPVAGTTLETDPISAGGLLATSTIAAGGLLASTMGTTAASLAGIDTGSGTIPS
jgi:hypothetical protein